MSIKRIIDTSSVSQLNKLRLWMCAKSDEKIGIVIKKYVCRQEEKRKFSLRLMEFAKIPYILTFQTYLDHCLSTRARDFHNSDDVHSFFPLSKKTKISK